MAHPKHDQVRQRYDQRCGYCGVPEMDAGGELTVDHYWPSTRGGDESDDNLVYACMRCNLYKSDFYPDAQELANGHRVLHPLRDNPNEHFRLNDQTGELEPLTETGRFHIELLHLNRSQLVGGRLRRQTDSLLTAKLRLIEAENQQLHTLLAAQEQYSAELEYLLDLFSDEE